MPKDLDWSDYERDGELASEPTIEDEDTSQLVSNEDIANAVRAHLKLAKWVQVAVVSGDEPADPGKWAIRTTDIAASGQWYIDGENPDGTPHIDILMEEYSSQIEDTVRTHFAVTSTVTISEPEVPTVTRGTTTDKEADEDVDTPSDDDVVNVQDRMEDVDRQWEGIKGWIHMALENGDPDSCQEALDLVPGLIVNIGNLMTALNRAVERAEEPHN